MLINFTMIIIIMVVVLTTIQVSEETHIELKKIKGELLARNGKERTFDEIIKFLIDHYKKTKA